MIFYKAFADLLSILHKNHKQKILTLMHNRGIIIVFKQYIDACLLLHKYRKGGVYFER